MRTIFEQLVGRFRIEGVGVAIGIDEMGSDVILDHLGHNPPSRRAPPRSDAAPAHTRLAIKRTLNRLDLAPDTAHPRQQLLLFPDCVRHAGGD